MRVSILIPVLNEREHLPQLLTLLGQIAPHAEIIVADGGSTDGTREWLQSRSQVSTIDAPAGRGNQLNRAAAQAAGDVLLILHADARPPRDLIHSIANTLLDPQVLGGAFFIDFLESDDTNLRIIARGINARTLITKSATGDQGIFVRRQTLTEIGGFQPWMFFEDVKLVTEIKRRGKFLILKTPIKISGRRYLQNGPWRTTLLMYLLRIGYWAGIHPNKLYQWFRDIRTHL